MATYARRRSSSSSSLSPGSTPLYGNISSSIPVRSTCSNSRPLAPCTVISTRVDARARRPCHRASTSLTSVTRSRKPASARRLARGLGLGLVVLHRARRAPAGSRRARRASAVSSFSSACDVAGLGEHRVERARSAASSRPRARSAVEQLAERGELLLRRGAQVADLVERARARRRATRRAPWPTRSGGRPSSGRCRARAR